MPTTATLSRPPMGYDTWRVYNNTATDTNVRSQANAMVSNGLVALGYNIINPSGASQVQARVGGFLTDNLTHYPSGVLSCANYCRSIGINWGVYSGPDITGGCSGFSSHGYEANDVTRFVGLGAVYLMYDSCYDFGSSAATQAAYQTMSTAITNGCPYPFTYLCSCPVYNDGTAFGAGVYNWFGTVGSSLMWTAPDLGGMTWAILLSELDLQVSAGLQSVVGPNHYGLIDFLGVGNGTLTDAQGRCCMSMFCLLASPLWIAIDLTSASQTTLATLSNKAAISIDQDPLTIPAVRSSHTLGSTEYKDIWYRQLSGGKWAVAFWNRDTVANSFSINWSTFGFNGNLQINDVWTGQTLGISSAGYTNSSVPSQSIQLLLLTQPSVYTMNSPNPNPTINPSVLFPAHNSLRVLQNTPPDMSVIVIGCPLISNSSASGITGGVGVTQIPLSAPGSNSYWATIYWDLSNNNFGVTYSASSSNPTVQYPDFVNQVPIATVLIPSSATYISQNMIADLIPTQTIANPSSLIVRSAAANPTFNCHAACNVLGSVATGISNTYTFTNIRVGVFLSLQIYNNAGGAINYTITLTAPSGVNIAAYGKTGGAANTVLQTTISLPAGNQILLTGCTYTTTPYVGGANYYAQLSVN